MKISRKIAFLYVLIQLYFFNILQTYSNDTVKSTVKGIFIEFELEKEQNNRKNALQKSYLIGLERYLDWITISSQKTNVKNLLTNIEPSSFVTSYSIESESFLAERYSALITVNFDIKKIESLLNEKGIKYFAGKGPETLVLPLMSYNNQLTLWDDPNPWFDVWLRRPLDSNLNLFTLPDGEANDLITLSAQDAVNLKYFKIKKLANKYQAEQAYILLVNVKSYNEKFNLSLKVYDGLTQEFIFSSNIENIETHNFDYNLNLLADTFADYFDDLWVKENLDNINSETKVLAEISYKKYNEWIKIKNFLNNNEKILKYRILTISNKNALIELNILSIDDFMEDLERNRFKIYKKENNLFISKDES